MGGKSQAKHDDLEHACATQGRGGPLVVRSDNEPAVLAFRDAVIRQLKQRFGVRAIAEAPPKHDSASVGMVENAIKQVKEKVRTLAVATRELHGVVMDPELL